MATRSIITYQPDVECDVCGRRLLRGERPDVFIGAGRKHTVCELCVPRATGEGWLRESEAQALSAGMTRQRGARSLLDRLRQLRAPAPEAEQELEQRRSTRRDSRRRAQPQPRGRTPRARPLTGRGAGDQEAHEDFADGYEELAGQEAEREAYEAAEQAPYEGAYDVQHQHSQEDLREGGYEGAYEGAYGGGYERGHEGAEEGGPQDGGHTLEHRHIGGQGGGEPEFGEVAPVDLDEAIAERAQEHKGAEGAHPVTAAQAAEAAHPQRGGAESDARRALSIFNSSRFAERVAGIARALGEPEVTVRPVLEQPGVHAVVIAWELCWYRYEVDLGDEQVGPQLAAEGMELHELPPEDRACNAAADERGELSLVV